MPGVQINVGDGDARPGIRDRILAADILVLATPPEKDPALPAASGQGAGSESGFNHGYRANLENCL